MINNDNSNVENTQKKINKKMKKYKVKISKQLRDIIHGYIMSDGYLSKEGNLQVEQSAAQAKFVQWMYEKLKPLCTETGPKPVIRYDSRTQGATHSFRFYTTNLLEGFAHMWYKDQKNSSGNLVRHKTLPKSIDCFFNSTFVTLWFAGDGTKETNERAAKIEATAFTREERLKLQELFKRKFGIAVAINRSGVSKSGTQQWVLRIPAAEYDKFQDIITKIDLIETLFPHKLHKKEP